MKRVVLLFLPLLMLCGNVNAKKPRLAKSVWFIMELQADKEKQPNDSIVVGYRMKDQNISYMPRPVIEITIQNNSERTIYVDKQKSFIIPNQQMFPLYTNTTQISSQGSTTMGGVGLGVVGIGGASSSYNTTMKQEDRFLIIPGDTKTVLEFMMVKFWGEKPWVLNNDCGSIRTFSERTERNKESFFILISQTFISKEEVQNYQGADTPLNLDFRICYSFNEDMSGSMINKTVFYTKTAIGADNFGHWREKDYELAKKLFPSLDSYLKDSNKLVFRIWAGENWMK